MCVDAMIAIAWETTKSAQVIELYEWKKFIKKLTGSISN
jgi:hypothetical protein